MIEAEGRDPRSVGIEVWTSWGRGNEGDQHADFSFAYGAPAAPVVFVSTVKLRKAGFNAAVDTRDAFQCALQWTIDHNLLPPAQG